MDEPTVAEALESWRVAERAAARSTAKREAADVAFEAAKLAGLAARATADAASAAQVAATAAQVAAGEAARAAQATADAADRVVLATQRDAEAAGLQEERDVADDRAARAAHEEARDRAERRYQHGG
jgi:hypothetical protein